MRSAVSFAFRLVIARAQSTTLEEAAWLDSIQGFDGASQYPTLADDRVDAVGCFSHWPNNLNSAGVPNIPTIINIQINNPKTKSTI